MKTIYWLDVWFGILISTSSEDFWIFWRVPCERSLQISDRTKWYWTKW